MLKSRSLQPNNSQKRGRRIRANRIPLRGIEKKKWKEKKFCCVCNCGKWRLFQFPSNVLARNNFLSLSRPRSRALWKEKGFPEEFGCIKVKKSFLELISFQEKGSKFPFFPLRSTGTLISGDRLTRIKSDITPKAIWKPCTYPALCIILDWKRKKGESLPDFSKCVTKFESDFLDLSIWNAEFGLKSRLERSVLDDERLNFFFPLYLLLPLYLFEPGSTRLPLSSSSSSTVNVASRRRFHLLSLSAFSSQSQRSPVRFNITTKYNKQWTIFIYRPKWC